MGEASEPDLELAELRARRREAMLAGRARERSPPPPPSRPVNLNGVTFGPFLQEHPRVAIDVWAPWCGPCRAMAPVLDALAQELAGAVQFAKLNADEEPTLAGRWGVEGIPTLLLFERGTLVDRIVGAHPHDTLERRLRATFRLSGPSRSTPGG